MTHTASVANSHSAAVKPLVEIQGVHKFFGDHHVLKGIDMTVNPGEVSVIIGPSGSGKSTLPVVETTAKARFVIAAATERG